MRSYVVIESSRAGKGPSAESALEGSIGGVGDHVIPQLVRRREDQAAESALIRIRRSFVAQMHLDKGQSRKRGEVSREFNKQAEHTGRTYRQNHFLKGLNYR